MTTKELSVSQGASEYLQNQPEITINADSENERVFWELVKQWCKNIKKRKVIAICLWWKIEAAGSSVVKNSIFHNSRLRFFMRELSITQLSCQKIMDELAHLFDSLSRISTVYSHTALIAC